MKPDVLTQPRISHRRLEKPNDSRPAGLRVNPPTDALSYLVIDANRLRHNLTVMQRLASESGLCAMVKKNAYGLGMMPLARIATEMGARMLGVYGVDEAEQLVTGGIRTPILLMAPIHHLDRSSPLYRHVAAGKLHPCIQEPSQLPALDQCARRIGAKLPVHLYLDTGMTRSGLTMEQFSRAVKNLPSFRYLHLAGIYSHLATACEDVDFANEQRGRLLEAVTALRGDLPQRKTWMLHLANSCGTWLGEPFHMDMIRPGLSLSGYGPDVMTPRMVTDADSRLQPPLSWWSKVNHVQAYPAGVRVGYGQTFKLETDAVLAVVPVGYADGYRVSWSNSGVVRLFDQDSGAMLGEAGVRGRVNMDQIVIDVTAIAHEHGESTIRDAAVEVISDDPMAPNSLQRLAKIAGTHIYEIQCGLETGLKRVWV